MADTLTLARLLPQDELTRSRRMATGVLAAMAAVFLGSHLVADPPGPLLLVRAIAEAGMIGGLADWFAVTALFRHPLGLPIPHTALLPKNQKRAAKNVGRFLETHFLQPTQIEARVRALEPARMIVGWLSQGESARAVARELTGLVAALLRQDPSPRALARARGWLRRQAAGAGSDAAIAGQVAELVKAGVRGGVAGEVFGVVRRAIDANRDVAVALVQENSRWWIASRVDRGVADLVVSALLTILDDLQQNGSDLRRDFEAAFDAMVDALEREGALTRAVRKARNHLVGLGAFDAAIAGLAHDFREQLSARLATAPEAFSAPLAELIRDTATRALAAPEARAGFDARLAGLAGRVVGEAGPMIAADVDDVIAGWAPEELNARFEEEIGPDLQFIRINGAVLGAMIGGALFGFEALVG